MKHAEMGFRSADLVFFVWSLKSAGTKVIDYGDSLCNA